ncbi:sensor histidine kinase [Streptomyces subrutilus]|uniref:sensor histidine kinase n=1 Tax=Streptomyces subrutilus TaxID=36818 RepID=UPI0033F87BE3
MTPAGRTARNAPAAPRGGAPATTEAPHAGTLRSQGPAAGTHAGDGPRAAPPDGDAGPRDRPRAGAPQADALSVNALRALCRRVLAVRMALIAAGTPLALWRTAPGGEAYLLAGAALLALLLSCALFRDGGRFGPLLPRHRLLLAPDLALGSLLLLAATATAAATPTTASPLLLWLVCAFTPLLAGLVHGVRGAAAYAALQAAVAALATGSPALAALCLLAGAAGACLRDLLHRVGAAGRTVTRAAARRAAAGAVRGERDRLAREMHDSVAKTLHGLALTADALSRTTDPAELHRQADLLATAARRAEAECRDLLTGLRGAADGPGDPWPPAVPPTDALADALRRVAPAGTELRLAAPLPALPHAVARQLAAVAAEALENTRRHAHAGRVRVEAAADDSRLTLTVDDDGRGLAAPVDLPALSGRGRFGLLGMAERAAAVGARLEVGARPSGPGTRVRLELPLTTLGTVPEATR